MLADPNTRNRLLFFAGFVALTAIAAWFTVGSLESDIPTAPREKPQVVAKKPAPAPEAPRPVPAETKPTPEPTPAAEPAPPGPIELTEPRIIEADSGWNIYIDTSTAVEFKHFTLDTPPRLVLDVLDATYISEQLTVSSPTPFFSRIRVGLQQNAVRFVIDFPANQVPKFKIDKSSDKIVIAFTQ